MIVFIFIFKKNGSLYNAIPGISYALGCSCKAKKATSSNISVLIVGYEMIKANSALLALLGIYHLMSKYYARFVSWNNC